MGIIIGILEQGLVYGIMALGIYLTYSILNFPDLTVDGSFPLGAAITASLILKGVNPYLVLLLSFGAGILAGICTGIIHVKFGVRDLLSGIIVMTGLYTINLTIASKANLPIFNSATIFNNAWIDSLFPENFSLKTLIVIFVLVLICKIILDAFMETKKGYLLRATGDNATLVTTLSQDSGNVKILGLAIANGLVALSGSILCQHQRFFDISIGTGTMVMGLASVIIGTKIFGRFSKLKRTSSALLGSIIYKASVAAAIGLGLSPNSMKLITALIFLGVLIIGKDKEKGVA